MKCKKEEGKIGALTCRLLDITLLIKVGNIFMVQIVDMTVLVSHHML